MTMPKTYEFCDPRLGSVKATVRKDTPTIFHFIIENSGNSWEGDWPLPENTNFELFIIDSPTEYVIDTFYGLPSDPQLPDIVEAIKAHFKSLNHIS